MPMSNRKTDPSSGALRGTSPRLPRPRRRSKASRGRMVGLLQLLPPDKDDRREDQEARCKRLCSQISKRRPADTILESHRIGILGEAESEALKRQYEGMNGIQLYQQIVRRLKRILRRQESWREQQRRSQRLFREARIADSALRAAPSGTSTSPDLLDGVVDLRPCPLSTRLRRPKRVQQLTNQKNNRQLQGARPI